ncbi:hypothetical protein ACFWGN_14485 [Oerskovia sp. NPDC060338]|uniref:hypothetical protein n=1 Tax=unclassified Oerskovia TaxID=2619021 RepID=UPI003647F98E
MSVSALLREGALVGVAAVDLGWTALGCAPEWGNLEVLEVLLIALDVVTDLG